MTDKHEFDQEKDLPACIESQPGAKHPLDQVIVRDLEEDPEPGSLPLEVLVRDPNVDQSLRIRSIVDNPSSEVASFPLEDTGTIERTKTLTVDAAEVMTPGCHRVKVQVAERFDTRPSDDAGADRRDGGTARIASAVWWVFTKSSTNPNPDPSGCPKHQP